jgi:uncharacterized membrane protein YciS (DUF1049 family)
VGLVNATLIVKFIEIAGNPASKMPLESVPAIAFAILIIPLFDTLRVFAIRMSRGRSPFTADRHHIHHYMLALGLSHRQATLVAVLFNAGFITLAFSLQSIGTTLLMGLVGGLAFGFTAILFVLKKRKEAPKEVVLAAEKLEVAPAITKPKILRINTEGMLQDK